MAISEHELLTFRRVKSALASINDGMIVKSSGPLAEALGELGCFPYASLPCDSFDLNCKLSIAGKPAGTFEKPDVDLILKESTASSFGKGETTVLDLTYRNGKEIPAQNIDITKKTYGYFSNIAEDEISAAMFVGKTVNLKLYKLAVYEEGGHFDWHMDTTHSDQHHATLLLALNTSWEGGNLKLRRNGIETLVDMHPKADRDGAGINLQAVAFYTDTEHKVEPVTKGIRIILQYDVEVAGWDEYEQIEDELDHMENISRKRKHYQRTSGSLTADNAVVTKVTNILASLLADGVGEVAFAMQYLYRKSSILPEFLKGADAQLYRALVGSFDVTLRPVILQTCKGRPESCKAIPWDQNKTDPGSESESDLGSDTGSEDDGDTKNQPKDVIFHLPVLSAIRQISHQSYIEHTGNEAQPGETKYFGGGMFVRQKEVAKKQ